MVENIVDKKKQERDDLSIDPHKLEEEVFNQAPLYRQYSDKAHQAENLVEQGKDVLKDLEDDLEEEKSHLAHKIRTKHTKYGFDKPPSNPAVDEVVANNEEIQDIKFVIRSQLKLLTLLKAEAGRARSVTRSMEMKKRMLELSVDLWGKQYYATPRENIDIEGGKRYKEILAEKREKHINEALAKYKDKKKSRKKKKVDKKDDYRGVDKITNPGVKKDLETAQERKRKKIKEAKREKREKSGGKPKRTRND